jgi:ABC-type anion transport system duplicated permease subunit
VRAVYLAMELVARFVIVPMAFASLLTGLVQSLGTPWGLFQHYWVLVKLLLTVFATIVLLVKMELIGYAARLAAETTLPRADLGAAGIQLMVHAAGGLLVLLVPMALSVYKPKGRTWYGRHKQPDQRPA